MTAGESCVGTSVGVTSAVIAAFSGGNSSRFKGLFERIGLPLTNGFFGARGLWGVLFCDLGIGFRGVVGLSPGRHIGGIGFFIVVHSSIDGVGICPSFEGIIFASQSSESSSAKKLSDMGKWVKGIKKEGR
jgi:hypothetical protein